jgi:hypothetical protein
MLFRNAVINVSERANARSFERAQLRSRGYKSLKTVHGAAREKRGPDLTPTRKSIKTPLPPKSCQGGKTPQFLPTH